MRRERKIQLRGIAINDAMARWQEGQFGFKEVFASFRDQTDATNSEMSRFALLLEEECIKYLQSKFAAAKQLKIPPIRTLCQRLYEIEVKQWDTSLMITRLAEFTNIWHSWIKYYKDLIYEWGVTFYESLAVGGMPYKGISWRIRNAYDIFVMLDNGSRRDRWGDIEARLKLWLKRKFGKIKSELQTFVEDRQNIHTQIANTQTDTTLKQLFAVVVSEDQRTFKEVSAEWGRLGCSDEMVLADVRVWAGKSMITTEDDWLYRRTLQHLWAKIKGFPTDVRDELAKRLYEECRDALGMCAQGHIARLTNVLVGFDDAFKAPVSLQDRMAEIARQESTEEEKRAAAATILNDFRVAVSERAAWLEALSGH
jgi:hypothetical protein